MAAVQTIHNMTLGPQEQMYNQVQNNCVIVSTAGFTQTANSVIQNKRPLAPAPERNTVVIANNTKRKLQFIPHSVPTMQPPSVARRNARERNRVRQVNNGFAALRQHIPSNVLSAFAPQAPSGSGRGANKKLSKVETLKMAVEYIRSLQEMLDEHETENSASVNESQNDIYFVDRIAESLSQQYNTYRLLPTPPSSEASASPTPSHTSEGSATSAYAPTTLCRQDSFENYEQKNADEVELIEAIFCWQQDS